VPFVCGMPSHAVTGAAVGGRDPGEPTGRIENEQSVRGRAGVLAQEPHHRRTGIQPLAGSARLHRHPPLHRLGLCLVGVQPAADAGTGRRRLLGRGLESWLRRLDLLGRHRLPGPRRGIRWQMAGRGRPPHGRRRRRDPLGRRVHHRLVRDLHPSALAALPRLRGAGRLRFGAGLCLARLDADPLVPRPPRHGDRHGHHGLRRRGDDRDAGQGLAAGDVPEGARLPGRAGCRRHRGRERPGLRRNRRGPGRGGDRHRRAGRAFWRRGGRLCHRYREHRRRRHLHGAGRGLFPGHDRRRLPVPGTRAELETRRLAAEARGLGHGLAEQRPYRPGAEDPAILAALDHAVLQRDRRDRRDWRRQDHDVRDLRLGHAADRDGRLRPMCS